MERKEIEKRENERRISRYKDESSAALTAWKVVGGTVITLVAVAFVVALPDIKRYIKISMM